MSVGCELSDSCMKLAQFQGLILDGWLVVDCAFSNADE
ncbi:hypothetical protein HNR48_002233 [Pseudoteredinibacter isoporae]|uniref:Uncharacterized protein n=1 Tax=Pseudoteredinibacter isoporae TaxID=570281 RepID=A0A7X0JUI1_9GAMM|nr:hypothetical protein [Pseudoteredinibacter isoporae]